MALRPVPWNDLKLWFYADPCGTQSTIAHGAVIFWNRTETTEAQNTRGPTRKHGFLVTGQSFTKHSAMQFM